MNPKFRHNFSIVCLAIFSVIAFSASLKTPKGFSLRLIPWDSTGPPHYQGNLTQKDRFQQLLMISNVRANRWGLTTSMRPDVRLFKPNYVIEVGFGSRPEYLYLEMDTGSDLIWVQGVDCLRCIDVKGGSFRYNESGSFEHIDCHSLDCPGGKCHSGTRCDREVHYEDGNFARCDLSTDYFTFPSDDPRHLYVVGRVVFGVGYYNIGFFEQYGNRVAGIFGLGPGNLSFVGQLLPYHLGRFSYCLPSREGIYTSLKFGDDANILPPGAQKTPFIPGPIAEAYFLSCSGISVAGVNIGLATDIFKYEPSRKGGFIIDTGTAITFLHPDAYDRLVEAMDKYFAAYSMKSYNYTGEDYWFTCYSRIQSFTNFPNMTFHLQGGDVNLDYRNIFFIDLFNICLLFRRNLENTQNSILGSVAQANNRFLYDLEEKELSFYPENCS